MASALALNLARHGREIRLYCIEPDVEHELNTTRCNTKYLAGIKFPAHVIATADIEHAVAGAKIVFVAVPSFAMEEVLRRARPFFHPKAIIASISKGLDPHTLEPLIVSEARLLPPALRKRVCALGGPAIATEMAKGSPTAFVCASADSRATKTLQRFLRTAHVKVATSSDVRGVGLAAAIKNPYAIALGLCDGLQHPTNAKAFILTLAIEEMAQILKRAGAHPETASGLAGLGDLIVTGFSPHGRNRTYGERLVGARSKDPRALGLTTVEGIAATTLTLKLARRLKVSAPLLVAIHDCLQARKNYATPFVTFLQKVTLS